MMGNDKFSTMGMLLLANCTTCKYVNNIVQNWCKYSTTGTHTVMILMLILDDLYAGKSYASCVINNG